MIPFDNLKCGDYNSPRFRRARITTNHILHLMEDYIPRDRNILRQIKAHILRFAYEQNIALISVPPEKDAMDELQIARSMIEMHPIILKDSQ